MAFIKYYHRCYAEIAKEAMSNQSLDFDEMISIKWANDDPDPKKENQYSELWHKRQIQLDRETRGVKKQQNRKKEENKKEETKKEDLSYSLPKKLPPPINATELEKRFKKDLEEQEKRNNDLKRLESILDKIHHNQPDTLAEIIFPSCLDTEKSE